MPPSSWGETAAGTSGQEPDPTACRRLTTAQSCPTLCDPVDCSPPGSSVHGILQAGILQWVSISSPRGSPRPRDQACVFCTGRQVLYHLSHQEAHEYSSGYHIPSPGDLSDPGIELGSLALQAGSLPAEPPGSPQILKWVPYPFSRGPF